MAVEIIKQCLPWVLSAVTIIMTIAAGNLKRNAWFIGIINQGLWLSWICLTENWGFLPMNLTLWFIYVRNHFKWIRSIDSKIT